MELRNHPPKCVAFIVAGVLTLITSTTATNYAVTRRENDIDKKLKMIGNIFESSNVVVANPKLPIKTMQDVVAYAKANPGVGFTSPGVGSMGHLGMAAVAQRNNLKMEHVAYRGSAVGLQDVAAGVVPLAFSDIGSALNLIRSGAIRAIAVGSEQRLAILSDVPTMAEEGYPEVKILSYGGLCVAAGTPADRVDTLTEALQVALTQPKVIERINATSADVMFYPPEKLKGMLKETYDVWSKVARENNITVE